MNSSLYWRSAPVRTYTSAITWSVFGTVFVFGLMVLINNLAQQAEETRAEKSVEFMVEKIQKPAPQKQMEKPKPKPKPKNSTPPSPMKGLDSNISGIDLGLPQFQLQNFADMGDSVLGDMSKVVMTEDSVDVVPKVRQRSAMKYPAKARAKGLTGYVLMNLLINGQGEVLKVRVLESSPPGVFDDVAIEGVKSWRFDAATYQGEPVQVWAKQKISFNLN